MDICHELDQHILKSQMSSHFNDALSDIFSDNVQELLNGELFNSESTVRRRKIKYNRFCSMNTDEIRQSMISGNFSSLQNINSDSVDKLSLLEQTCIPETNGNSDKESDIMEESIREVVLTDQPVTELIVLPETETEHLKNLIKEKDRQLMMAAQYGISLVNKSQELETVLEKEKEQSKVKLEEINNEKHQLKRMLESQWAEHQTVVFDLKSDLSNLKKVLEEERKNAKTTEKEYQEKIQELSACNEVLSEQILSASIHEEEARTQVSSLKLQVTECETEQFDQVQALENELTDLRSEMEKMVQLKADECKILSFDLDTVQERLNILEKERNAEMARAQHLQEELLRLEDKYVILLSKIDSPTASMNSIASTNPNEMSLFAELDVLSDAASTFDFITGRNVANGKSIIGTQLRQEILEVYRQVQRLIMEVKGQGNLWSPEIVDIADLKAGQLLLSLSELQDLMSRRFGTTTLPPLYDERSRLEAQVSYLKEQSNTLREQLAANQITLDSVKAELTQRDHQLRRTSEEKSKLEKMILELRQEVVDLQGNLDELRESKVAMSEIDVLREVRRERDDATNRKNTLEDEIFRLKIDLSSLDHQLIESVEQKLQLSNQLEAWQNDMHDLIEDKLAGEIARDNLKGRKRSTPVPNHRPIRPSYLKKFGLKWS